MLTDTEKRPCWKLNYEGITLYVSLHDSKYALGNKSLITPPDDVKVEAPGFCVEHFLAINLANTFLAYQDGSEYIEAPLSGGKGAQHPFIPDKYKVAPGPVYDMVSGYVEQMFTSYILPVDEAKKLAYNYLESLKLRNPQDPHANNH